MRTDDKTFVDELRTLAKIEEPEVIREHLESIRPEDIADALSRLEVEEGLWILQKLSEEKAAEILFELPTENARAFLDELPDATVALTLRDPVAVLQSAITMLAYGDRNRRVTIDADALAVYWVGRRLIA